MATGNFRLIAEDCLLEIGLGPGWDGSVNPYPALGGATLPTGTDAITVASYMGVADRFGHTETVDKINVKSLGDRRKANRYNAGEGEITIEGFVPAEQTTRTLPVSAIGCYIGVEYSPLSTDATPEKYVGVITKWQFDSNNNNAQKVNITVDLDPDYLPVV